MKQFDIPEQIDDSFIIQFFSLQNTNKINPSRTKESFIKRFINISNYLTNRFTDSDSFLETIYRIFNKIEEKPKCKNCGTLLQFHPRHHFREFCSQKCVQNFDDIRRKKSVTREKHISDDLSYYKDITEKRKKTLLERYGVEYATQSDIIKEKIKQTNIKRLGVPYASQSDIIKEKIKQTNIKRLGVPYTAQNKQCLEKMKQTCLEKYGVEHNFQILNVRENIKQKWIDKYGYDNPMKNNVVLQKSIDSKRKHHTFNTSKIEEQFYTYLCSKYTIDNINRQYKTNEYPFCCDFYIKPLNLYIEIQGYWAHGSHPFDKTNNDDVHKLEIWKEKSKNNLQYEKAINIWTVKDVLKRETAQINNLNYLEIFSIDLQNAIDIFENYINKS